MEEVKVSVSKVWMHAVWGERRNMKNDLFDRINIKSLIYGKWKITFMFVK